MFSQISAQISASVLNTALALLTTGLACTIVSPSSYAQSTNSQAANSQAANGQASTRLAQNTKSTKAPSPVFAATSKRSTDWWVPGILGGSVMVSGVVLALMLKRSNQALVTEPPEPLRYSPDPKSDPKPISTPTDLKATQAPTQNPSPQKTTPQSEIALNPEAKKSESKKNKAKKSDAIQAETHKPVTHKPEAQQPETEKLESVEIAHTTTRMPKISVMDVLVHDLRSTDPTKRQKAIWELGRRGDSRAVQPLVDLLLDSDSRQRSLVLSALSEISTRTLKPMSRALAISMQDENADVRKNAIRDLTRIYDTLTNISQLLHSACDDPDLEVQETAKWAIGQINRIKSPITQGAGRSVSLPESLN